MSGHLINVVVDFVTDFIMYSNQLEDIGSTLGVIHIEV